MNTYKAEADKIELKYAIITYKEPIVYIQYTNPVLLDAKEVGELHAAVEIITDNKPRLILNESTVQVDATSAGRTESTNYNKTANTVAIAFVVKSLAQRLIAIVFMVFSKPPFLMQVFGDSKKAEKWLMEQWEKAKS